MRKWIRLTVHLGVIASLVAAASALAIECQSLLHTNLVQIKIKIEGDQPPTHEADDPFGGTSLISSAEDGGFFATRHNLLGHIDPKSGKFTTLIRAKKSSRLVAYTANENFVGVMSFDNFEPTDPFASRKTVKTKEITHRNLKLGYYFFDKRTRKVVAIGEYETTPLHPFVTDFRLGKNTATVMYATKDILKIVDLHTGSIRELTLPVVPSALNSLDGGKAVVLTVPGKSPIVLDLTTRKSIPIKGLANIKFSSARGPQRYRFEGEVDSPLVLSRTSKNKNGKVTAKKSFTIDLARGELAEFPVPALDLTFDKSTAGGRLLIFRQEMGLPDGLTERGRQDWYTKHSDSWNPKTLLLDAETGKPVLPPGDFNIIDGNDQCLIQVYGASGGDGFAAVDGPGAAIEEKFYLYGKDGRLREVRIGPDSRFAEISFDPKADHWIARIDTNSGHNSHLEIYSKDWKSIDRLPLDRSFQLSDLHGRFLGLVKKLPDEKLMFYRKPRGGYRASSPPEGWNKESVDRLSKLTKGRKARAAYPYWIDFFGSGIYSKYPESTAAIFLNVFTYSNVQAGHLLERYPEVLEVLRTHPLSLEKLDRADFAEQWRATQNFLRVAKDGGYFSSSNVAYFYALRPLLGLIPTKAVEDIVDGIAETYKNSVMASTTALAEAFASKIYKVVRHSFAESFGLKENPITDLTVTQSKGDLKLLAIGSHGIEGGIPTPFGISYRELGNFKVDENVKPNQVVIDQEVNWVHNGESYSAKVVARTSSRAANEIVTFADAPDYAGLLKDKKMTTAVVTGSNLLDDSAEVLAEYLQSFRDRGFRFEKDITVPNVRDFLKQRLENGEIDLFIKEAHSDGDEKNLFRVFKSAQLRVGRRSLPSGEEEVVYLFYPSKDATEATEATSAVLISNQEFGEWMRTREKSGVPLYYLNSSCWSATKAKAEIQAAGSPILVEIPSLTMMDEFTDVPGSTMYETLFGFLDRKSFDAIEAAALKDPETRASDPSNILLWPSTSGKELYLKEVLANFKLPVDIRVEVRDSKGRIINIDEQ